MITPSCRRAQIEPPPDGLSRVSLDNIKCNRLPLSAGKIPDTDYLFSFNIKK